jgi:two-component system sensor histidine kinase EvgS
VNAPRRMRGLLVAWCILAAVSVCSTALRAAPVAPQFTAEERVWLATHPVIRYAIDPYWPPLEYISNGNPKGLSIEYLKEITKQTGIRFEFVPTRNWEESLAKFRSGEVKLLPGTTARRILFDTLGPRLTNYPYYSGTTVVVSKGDRHMIFDPKDLADLRVAVAKDSETSRWLLQNVPTATLVRFDSPQEMLDAVVTGDADVALGPEIVLLPQMRRSYRSELNAAGTLAQLPVELSIVLAPDQVMMASVLDKLVRGLTALQTDEVFDRWLDDADFGRPSVTALLHYYWLPGTLAAALGALLALTTLIAVTARRAARRAEAEKSRFLAVMSHEIRNAMNAVVGPIDMLLHAPDSEARGGLLRTAHSGSQMLLHTVNNLLDLSKLRAGKAMLCVRATWIREVIDEVVDMARRSAQDKQLQLNVQIDNDLRVMIDDARYRQVVLNVVTNAIKFTPRGEVSIVASMDRAGARQMLRTQVRDTGIGIAPDALKRLFVDYAQVEGGSDASGSGTGLGLSICKEIVQLMGGVISAASVSGEGTTVTFELPVETLSSLPPLSAIIDSNNTATADQAGALASKTAAPNVGVVLVIDDNAVNRQVLAEQLSLLGFASRLCDGAKSGLQAWRERDYALIFLDCQMPDIDGYDACRMMRREEAETGAKPSIVLALSARTGSEHTLACLEAGMNGVLTKPLNLNVLRATLDMWTDPASWAHGVKDAFDPNSARDPGESLAALFQRTCAADSAAIRAAVANRDTKELAVYVHRLRGAALAFGSAKVAEIAAGIEAAGMHADCDWVALAGRVQALDAAIGPPPPRHD